MATAFVHGLSRVVPDWCEARENDLRQGNTWVMDNLVASLSDHIRHSNNSTDPVKSFTAIVKQDEEKQVLSRIANRTKDGNNKTHDSNKSNKSTSVTAPNKARNDRPPVTWCDICEKEHTGGTKLCWATNPELKPQHIKDKEKRHKSQHQTQVTSNIAFAKNDYDVHSYFTNKVSPSITAYGQRLFGKSAAIRSERTRVSVMPLARSAIPLRLGSCGGDGSIVTPSSSK